MADKKEVEILLHNIQEGLKRHSIEELNEAIIHFLNKKENKSEAIDYLFNIVSKEYNTNSLTLKKQNIRGELQEAKQIIYCVLHYNLGFSIRYIAKRIFFSKWHASVYTGINKLKNFDANIKQDREFMQRYEKINAQFMENFSQKI